MPLSLEEKMWRLNNDPAWTKLLLPVDSRPDVTEEVLVEKLGDNRYRVASSPGMVEGLAADDVIALVAMKRKGFRILQRGKNVCVHLFCEEGKRDAIQTSITSLLANIGGWLDGTMGTVGLCYTIPVTAGFPAMERIFRETVGDEWYYSNVYDEATGSPLNWWLD